MSTIGGLNSSSELAQLLNRSVRSSTTTSGAGGTEKSGRGGFDAKFKEAALASGLKAEDVDALQADIQSAVAAAKESSGETTDDREAVKTAIDGVLQKYGVDLDEFQSQMQPPQGGPGGPGGAGGPPPGGGPQGGGGKAEFQAQFLQAAEAAGLDASSADELQEEIDSTISNLLSNSSSDSSDTQTSIQNAIDSLLEKYGVDLDEFKSQMQQFTGEMQSTFPLVDEQA